MFVHNTTVRQYIAVRTIVIAPKGYCTLSAEELEHPSIQQHLRAGVLEIVHGYDDSHTPAQMTLANLDPYGDLVLQRSFAYGDIMMTTAVIRSIATIFPDLTIHFGTVTKGEELLRYNSCVIVTADLGVTRSKIQRYGHFIDLNNVPEVAEDKSRPNINLNRIELMCHHIGIEPTTLCPEIHFRMGELEMGRHFSSQYPRPFLGIAPYSRRIEKMYPIENWNEVVSLWHRRTGGTVFVFHPAPISDINDSHAVYLEQCDLRFAATVGFHMNCFVTLDSLWTHLAAALGVPQVLLVSCTDGGLLSKGYPSVNVLRNDFPCYPCWYCFSLGGCTVGQYPRCLAVISPNTIFEWAFDWWERKQNAA